MTQHLVTRSRIAGGNIQLLPLFSHLRLSNSSERSEQSLDDSALGDSKHTNLHLAHECVRHSLAVSSLFAAELDTI